MNFLLPEHCCLYVVDPQERLMAQIHEAGRVVKNIGLMIRLARTFALPIISNTQYRKGVGPIVRELADLLTDVPCPDKVEFNGLANAEVRRELDRLPATIDTLLLCGVETHICIYQTAMGALADGYKVRVVADAVSSRTPENDSFGRDRLRDIGAIPAPAEMIIYELLRQAGTSEFKAMLPHLK